MEKDKAFSKIQEWQHPGGKLREVGPEALSDTELLAIIISSGIPGKPAEKIAIILKKIDQRKRMKKYSRTILSYDKR